MKDPFAVVGEDAAGDPSLHVRRAANLPSGLGKRLADAMDAWAWGAQTSGSLLSKESRGKPSSNAHG